MNYKTAFLYQVDTDDDLIFIISNSLSDANTFSKEFECNQSRVHGIVEVAKVYIDPKILIN